MAKVSIEVTRYMKKIVSKAAIFKTKVEVVMTVDIGGLVIDYLLGGLLWNFHIFNRIISILPVAKAVKKWYTIFVLGIIFSNGRNIVQNRTNRDKMDEQWRGNEKEGCIFVVNRMFGASGLWSSR